MDDFQKLKLLNDAYSDANKQSNRAWVGCAAIVFLMIANIGNEGDLILFGANLRDSSFYAASAIILSAINVVYCANHSNAHRIGIIYRDFVFNHFQEREFYKGLPWPEVSLKIYHSNFSRIHPIFAQIEKNFPFVYYFAIKFPMEALFCLLPAVGILIALASLSNESAYKAAVYLFAAFSIFCSLNLIYQMLLSIHNMLRRANEKSKLNP